MDTEKLGLPREVADKLGAGRVMFQEVSAGILLVPLPKKGRPLFGLIKDTGLTLDKFMAQKRADKDME
jgi:hypothetical protein